MKTTSTTNARSPSAGKRPATKTPNGARKPARSGKPSSFADIPAATENLFDRRTRLIDEHLQRQQPEHRMAMAMCRLDRLTDPAELHARGDGGCGGILELTRYLALRTLQRASWTLVEHEFEPDRRLDEAVRPTAIEVEQRLREALLAAFPNSAGGPPRLDLGFFEATFAAYTVGAIGMNTIAGCDEDDLLYSHGQPDGANYFAFAEATLLFLRLGLEPRFWDRLLPAFVAGASCFAELYWEGKKRRADAYKPRHRRIDLPAAAVRSAIEQLRLANTGQIAQRFSLTVAMALADDPALSFPSPLRKEFQ